jgi:hypothetical protein
MYGPAIICRSLSRAEVVDRHGNRWQYYAHGDHHARVAAWAIAFDLLLQCPSLRRRAEHRRIGFVVNREMRDFWTGDKRCVDFVLGEPVESDSAFQAGVAVEAALEPSTLKGLCKRYAIVLDERERELLEYLPDLPCVPIRNIQLAVETRACMTAHAAAVPRLTRDLTSNHRAIHGAADAAIAVAFVIVNAADEFLSPGRNRFPLGSRPTIVTRHAQPRDAGKVSRTLDEVPCRQAVEDEGYDALGLIALSARNDGGPVRLVTGDPAPRSGERYHYDQMVSRIVDCFEQRFADC